MFPYQLTNEIHLRLLQKQHAQELFRVTDANREHLRRWLPWLDQIRKEEDSAAFISSMLRSFADTGTFVCGIWHREELSGVIGYSRIDWSSRIAFPGYWLAKESEGRGIMTQCCRALVDHAFNEYRLNRVEIAVATANQRSQAIADRLGFTREGTLREAEWLYDHFVDHTVNALLRQEQKEPNEWAQATARGCAPRRV